jgi:hypothetical protein
MSEEKEICSACQQAEVLEDSGFPESYFYHCYSSDCGCTCSDRKDSAIAFFREKFFQSVQNKRTDYMKNKYPEFFKTDRETT